MTVGPSLCKLCDKRHWAYEPHSFAINTPVAINTGSVVAAIPDAGGAVDARKDLSVVVQGPPDITPNRRSREAYNTYM